ncbi:MAG: DNA ligase [Candidatus Diapherotrites archaeon ADurb.Bin253]|nr:MAG: DNA ligase [Candidatus Diapherotrites archaeon ADurb.Bin253]HNZ52195.1 ATP-dependent DNA ligase [Candidatus Pacearchaeota archaeon]HOH04472.1 ATP-dependent DNA ligase [Candidatus Pacearchaeota archaeon]HPX74535.1 ATP-dependent DNA ligase [Candidatus Pacearchaeota archaeon]HQC61046.1 ATP-dependent DNA ligase [Candidatus Pacearchaeota archaeon]
MLYSKLAELYENLGNTTKRLEKIEILSKFLEYLSEKDKDILYLLNGEIYPTYDERKIGISNQLVIKAISKASGNSPDKVVQEWKKIGDLGKVAEKLINTKKQSTLFLKSHLTTDKVIENLRKLPELEGEGTIEKKLILITELLISASPIEALYIVRTLLGDLRIGIQESTIRESLAKAFFNSDKESSKIIQEAIDHSNDLAKVFLISKKGKISEFDKIGLEVGKPIKAMLAQKVKNIEEGFKAVGKPCAIEYKYDGFRLIIHKKDSKIKLFTRKLENVTKQFPEAVEYIQKYVRGESFILDSEAIGYNKKTKEYTPFQAISQRIRRKYNIEKIREELPIEINVFDILYYNGKSLIKEPFEKRTQLIRKIIKETPYKIVSSKQIITDDLNKAEEFYKKALKDNQEGIMMKNLSTAYQPGNRVGHMLKVKPSEKDLDLVITGAEYGTGKRSGWLSSFILSCMGKEEQEFLEIGRVGTGIKEKDEQEGVSFNELNDLLKPLIIKEQGKDVKIKPKIIVAVTYQEIQESPNYSSGWALRFPRITSLRPDKHLSEIASLQEIEKEVKGQKSN